HLLAVEVLRYRYHMHPQIEPSRRVCRFCKTEVEAPEHALSACNTTVDVVALRTVFWKTSSAMHQTYSVSWLNSIMSNSSRLCSMTAHQLVPWETPHSSPSSVLRDTGFKDRCLTGTDSVLLLTCLLFLCIGQVL
ncbi:hypothetical protein C8J57DRAFT_1080625, partial [Mycena rebaudengoi]